MYLRSVELMMDKVENRKKYPFDIPAIESLKRLEFRNNITFLSAKMDRANPPCWRESLINADSIQRGRQE